MPPPGVFCAKSVDLVENRGDKISGRRKKVRKTAEIVQPSRRSGGKNIKTKRIVNSEWRVERVEAGTEAGEEVTRELVVDGRGPGRLPSWLRASRANWCERTMRNGSRNRRCCKVRNDTEWVRFEWHPSFARGSGARG